MTRRASLDPALSARIVARRPLHYAAGPSAALDRPAHVRAASAVVSLGASFVIVQDDASFLAAWDPGSGVVTDVPLPAGADGVRLFGDDRGNKADKLDLEALVAVDRGAERWLVAFGSGSSPRRERIVLALAAPDGRIGAPRVIAAPAFYAALRAEVGFAGSELNVEGAVADGDDVILLQRGNGAAGGRVAALDATARVPAAVLLGHLLDGAPAPRLRDVTAYDLGAIEGARLTFTDATRHDGALLYVASAEASPDAVRDGPVRGVALGILPEGIGDPRYAPLLDEAGAPCVDKVEGIVSLGPGRLLGVVDRDDVTRPAELLEIAWGH